MCDRLTELGGALADCAASFEPDALSPAQAAAVAAAGAADAAAEARLLEAAAARRTPLADLRDECARSRAVAARDGEDRRRAIHAARSVRDWTDPEGVWHLHAT